MPEIVPIPEEFLPRVPDRCIPDHYRVSPVRLTPEGARRIKELKALAEARALENRTLEPPLQAIPREDLEVLLREVQVEGGILQAEITGPIDDFLAFLSLFAEPHQPVFLWDGTVQGYWLEGPGRAVPMALAFVREEA